MRMNRLIRNATVLGSLSLALMGCESFGDTTMFNRPPPPLPGVRHNVFPTGVAPTDSTVQLPYNPNATTGVEPAQTAQAARRKKRR